MTEKTEAKKDRHDKEPSPADIVVEFAGGDEKKFPSVDLAYAFTSESYRWAQARWEAVDGRIQSLLSFIVTINLAIPVIIRTSVQHPSFRSVWFTLALITFAAAVFLGIYARFYGEIILVSPKQLFEKWLDLSEWNFKKDMIYWAGEHFENNRKVLATKMQLAIWMIVLFFTEGVFLAIWAIKGI